MAHARKKQRLSNGSVAVIQTSENAEERRKTAEITPSEDAQHQHRSLFVRSLPANTTSESLTDLFSETYPIKHATAVIDPVTKQCRGYGFVTFADAEDARSAQEQFNGYTLDGRKLRVEIAKPRHRDAEGAPSAETAVTKNGKNSQDLPQSSRLIIRNLPWTIKTSDQLARLFLSYGKVKQAYIPKTGHGRMAGFGFVVLRGRKNAEKALEGINGKEIDGRTVAVDWAVSKDVYEEIQNQSNSEVEDQTNEESSGAPGRMLSNGDGEEEKSDEDAASEILDDVLSDEDAEIEDEAEDEDIEMDDGNESDPNQDEDRSSTIFVRNLPFTCTDEDLEDHFTTFGKTRYARVVVDSGTERSKGTGFVCFYRKSDADACLQGAPRQGPPSVAAESKDRNPKQAMNSILQNQDVDLSGQYTMDGRVLQVSRAVDKSEANRLTQAGTAHRLKRDEDKRHLYLLSEGTISSKSKLWEKLSPTERNMREASSKQRKALIESNPSLHLSLTRLSVRNIPRIVTSKHLKALAREAVVGFATDVKEGLRQKLSKDELARGGEDMESAEKARKQTGKGIVKQAKVVFEGASGSKVEESSGAGKSRGYGFIEYYTHRNALMGLRWLNGHAVGYQVREERKNKSSKEQIEDRKKRLIVEFAIENAQVVVRRKDREKKARERSEAAMNDGIRRDRTPEAPNDDDSVPTSDSRKRKRGSNATLKPNHHKSPKVTNQGPIEARKTSVDAKVARRNEIIGRKRRARKGMKH